MGLKGNNQMGFNKVHMTPTASPALLVISHPTHEKKDGRRTLALGSLILLMAVLKRMGYIVLEDRVYVCSCQMLGTGSLTNQDLGFQYESLQLLTLFPVAGPNGNLLVSFR